MLEEPRSDGLYVMHITDDLTQMRGRELSSDYITKKEKLQGALYTGKGPY
jgi:hypothetical protein